MINVRLTHYSSSDLVSGCIVIMKRTYGMAGSYKIGSISTNRMDVELLDYVKSIPEVPKPKPTQKYYQKFAKGWNR